MRTITLHVGKALTPFLQDGQQRSMFMHALEKVRRQLFVEYAMLPPNIAVGYGESIGVHAYAFKLEGFGQVVYEVELWDIQQEKQLMMDGILVHYERFLRKWYTQAPDLYIEEKIKTQSLVIEYGEAWVDVLESDAFYGGLQSLAREYGIELEEPPYWESDYVGKDQLMVYVYGKDHFVKAGLEKTKDALLQEVLLPILRSNRLRIQHAKKSN